MRAFEHQPYGRRLRQSGFTLVEVLAALLFMAVVIPVAVDGLRVASRASVVGQRKAVAARIAERLLNEQVVTSQSSGTGQSGTVREGSVDYAWTVRLEIWNQNQGQTVLQLSPMQMMTAQVNFPVQGQVYNVHLSTLLGAVSQ
jgi:prepilin-type N-terminal cleavage/methylation domain-containing protein